MTKDDQARDAAEKMARGVMLDLRQVALDARRTLEAFEEYVESWATELADPERDPRALAQTYVVVRAEQMMDELHHIHSGSTAASHQRTAKHRLFQLAALGDPE